MTDNLPFPEEITSEILARLPVKPLLRCRRSCKSWRNLASDPGFVDRHLSFSSQRNPSLILKAGTTGRGPARNRLFFVENEGTPRYTCDEVKFEIPDFQLFRIVCSCDGLLCLIDTMKSCVIYICNPCTGKHINIPVAPLDTVLGFGVNPITHEYKVIGFAYACSAGPIVEGWWQRRPPDLPLKNVFVYTLGDASWRFKGSFPNLSLGESPFQAFVNGALHFVSGCDAKLIISFDMATELFGLVPFPKMALAELGRSYSLRVLKGDLSILNYPFQDSTEIWVMNDYGVVESWTHNFTIDHRQFGRNIGGIHVVCLLEDGENLLLCSFRALFCYNLRTKTASELKIDGLPEFFNAVAHVGSLVSPP